jgi:hypothetical protein
MFSLSGTTRGLPRLSRPLILKVAIVNTCGEPDEILIRAPRIQPGGSVWWGKGT